MLIQGSIRRFSLVAVLQFLATSQATGVLEVRDFEEYGFIYLVNGHVEGISLPMTDEKLGTRLVSAGFLTDLQLSEALLADAALTHEQKRNMPLGERLIEMGVTTEEAVRQIMEKQTMDQAFELAHWENGVFSYDEPDEMPRFQIAIQSDVQGLLLDAQRRIDEGQTARKRSNSSQSEICYGCPIASECDETIRDRYLKNDVCLWRRMSPVVDEGEVEGDRDARELLQAKRDAVKIELDASRWD